MRHKTKKNRFFVIFFKAVTLSAGLVAASVFVVLVLNGAVYAKPSQGKEAGTVKTETSKDGGQVENGAGTLEEGIPEKEYSDNDFRPQVEEEPYAWLVIKTILIMALLIGGFYYFFRFVTKKAGIQVLGQDVAKVLSVIPLGQNKYLQVVDMAGKILVLGVSDNSINLITEIQDRDEINRLRIQSQKSVPRSGAGGGFQEYLARGIGRVIDKVSEVKNRRTRHKTVSFDPGTGLDYLKEQRKRLKDLNGYDHE